MTGKSITLDLDAYEAIARRKGPEQSFSQVVKGYFGHRCTGRDLAALLDRITLSDQTLDAIDEVIEERRRDIAHPIGSPS